MVIHPPGELWVDTPLGRGRVLWVIDRGPDSDDEWKVLLDDCRFMTFDNSEVAACRNYTKGTGANWSDLKRRGSNRSGTPNSFHRLMRVGKQ